MDSFITKNHTFLYMHFIPFTYNNIMPSLQKDDVLNLFINLYFVLSIYGYSGYLGNSSNVVSYHNLGVFASANTDIHISN